MRVALYARYSSENQKESCLWTQAFYCLPDAVDPRSKPIERLKGVF
jgi:hypothetical protein